jgi:sulfatase modifying factor 1
MAFFYAPFPCVFHALLCLARHGGYWDKPGFEQTDRHPVTCVSWNDTQALIKWLNTKEDRQYRLPTEAEWEYACRTGTETRYYAGNSEADLDRAGWYYNNSGGRTHPVRQREPNRFGLYDMHGNVWEWCSDWYGDYPTSSVTDPQGPSSGDNRVLRGGCWCSRARNCRSANRGRGPPGRRDDGLGFRLAASLFSR